MDYACACRVLDVGVQQPALWRRPLKQLVRRHLHHELSNLNRAIHSNRSKVLEELQTSEPRPGLWAKAFADSNGNKATAQALYLRYRVSQLADEEVRAKNAYRASLSFPERFTDDQWYGLGIAVISGILLVVYLLAYLL